MSESPQQEDIFWDVFESFIQTANKKAEEIDLGIISAALMHAAARFNAFYIAASSESRDDLKQDKDGSVSDFGSEYKRLLAEHISDYIENYKVYLRSEDDK